MRLKEGSVASGGPLREILPRRALPSPRGYRGGVRSEEGGPCPGTAARVPLEGESGAGGETGRASQLSRARGRS